MMDEDDWFTSADAVGMLRAIFPMPGPHSSQEHTRLGRLYLAACGRRQWAHLPWACRKLVEVAEAYADDPQRGGAFAALALAAESLPGRPGTPADWAELADL